ncbi:E3 ubiquitin-protein ligase TRIM38 [Octodon degus]|uniref:E3 ubiquitin-protein ligase TRIM38 n=1 Tax=Octodon degus TaxID=10160 RepID=A0A6P3F781_OCTDE|nr:E3 ubiquitin-protein ligase TRIM38 [Octodon degus]
MTSTTITQKVKEIATCFICKNVMVDPVSISCGHSYCRSCLIGIFNSGLSYSQSSWKKTQLPCNICKELYSVDTIRVNKLLGSLVELIQEIEETEDELLCEAHEEQLQLFCEDDGQLICWRCERAPQHQGHATELVEDVCQGYKEKLEQAARNLNQLQEECMDQIEWVTTQIDEWKDKIEIQKQKIKSDFKCLQTFLLEEEKLYLWRLEKEEEQMLKRLQENEAKLRQKSKKLKSHILKLEEKCQSSAQKLLQDVKGTLSRTCAVKLETPEALSLEVQTACDVAELYLDVKAMVRRHQVSVTRDPDAAHPALTPAEDQKQESHECSQQNLSVSSRRFTALPRVLGCEGFSSGRHYFEVDVGEEKSWVVGVCTEDVLRGFGMEQEPELGFWAIRLCTESIFEALTSPPSTLELCEEHMVVGVALDYEAGAVSFYSMASGSHIFTFPKASFSGTLWPFFHVYQHSALFLPPSIE